MWRDLSFLLSGRIDQVPVGMLLVCFILASLLSGVLGAILSFYWERLK
jgi:hypothetical protein